MVLSGARFSALLGSPPGEVVAFSRSSGWVQIAVQIDERAEVAYQTVYGPAYVVGSPLTTLAYTDATTRAGADPDASFDADDVLVFMAADAGPRAPVHALLPAGVLSGGAVEVRIEDPLDGSVLYAYLYPSVSTHTNG